MTLNQDSAVLSAFATSISNEELALLPAAEFRGEIVVVEDAASVAEACDYLSRRRILGFDTETRPSFTPKHVNKMSLLQLSTDERCYLIRFNRLGGVPDRVAALLENPEIMKIGVAVAGDIFGLNKLRRMKPKGFFELQEEVKKFGIENFSLRKMSGIILGERVSKAQRLSNWEAAVLTDKQMIYAATDAWVCLKIYDALKAAASTDSM